MMKDKRTVATIILALLLLAIIGIVFFSRGRKGNLVSPTENTMAESTALTDIQNESSSLNEGLTTAGTAATADTMTAAAGGKRPSPSKYITNQDPHVTMVAKVNSGEGSNELIEKDEYFLVTNADFVHIKEGGEDIVATSDTFIRKDVVITFHTGSYNDGDVIYEDLVMTFKEYLDYNQNIIRASLLETDEKGWIIAFSDSHAG